MEEVLQNLVNLQYIDSIIDEIRCLRGDLPEEILDIETDVARLEAKHKQLVEEDKNLKLETNQLLGDVEEANGLIEKYEKQQMSVRNNREYDALTKEVESQKQRVENAKSRLEEISLLLEENVISTERTANNLAEIKAVLNEKKENLNLVIAETEAEEKALLERREIATKAVTDRYLRSYQRLRTGYKNGLAVVAMDRGACLGIALPPQTQVEVRRRNKIIIDEHSGRIVVDKSFFTEAAQAFKNRQ